MRREKAINVFLFFFLQAMLFVCFFPIYYSIDKIHVRTVSLPERMFSLLFVLLWVSLCVYCAWKKRLPLLVGGAMYSIMAYLPGWFLPHFEAAAGSVKPQGLAAGIFEMLFRKMYELASAPLVGVSLLVSEKTAVRVGKWLLPALLISYAGTHIFRFYHNAYLAEQLHLEDTAFFSNPDLARKLAVAPGSPVRFDVAVTQAPDNKSASSPAPNAPVKAPVTLPVKAPVTLPANAPVTLPPNAPITLPANMPINLPANMPVTYPARDSGSEQDDNDQTRLHTPMLPK